jgi:survival-of-motor-neuron-related-splicing factor 30
VRQLEHLRPPPKVILVPKAKVAKKEEEDILTAEFVIPDNLRLLPTDTEEIKKRKRKKVKALKANFLEKKTTAEESQVRNEWESFKNKAAKKKPVGALSNLKKESIFKSPDEVGGKVGVTGSGQGLTEYDARKRQRLV